MTSDPVQSRIEWSVRQPQAVAVGSAAHGVMHASRREAGCVTCSLATRMAERVTFTLVEEWDSEADLRRHLASPTFEALAGLLESALEAPRIEFALASGIRGLDYVTEVRGRARGVTPWRGLPPRV